MIGYLILIIFLIIIYIIFNTFIVKKNIYTICNNLKSPITIVHISDIHGRVRYLNGSISKMINKINPDFVCITGDLANNRNQLTKVVNELNKIECKKGIYFVPGNYEREELCFFKKKLINDKYYLKKICGNIEVLENSHCTIKVKGSKVLIYGIDNSFYGIENYDKRVNDIENNFKIIMAHSPNVINYVNSNNINYNLIMVGHTHGGQIKLFRNFIGNYRKFHIGMKEVDKNKFFCINKGLGTVKIPFRIHCLPEIVIYYIK